MYVHFVYIFDFVSLYFVEFDLSVVVSKCMERQRQRPVGNGTLSGNFLYKFSAIMNVYNIYIS